MQYLRTSSVRRTEKRTGPCLKESIRTKAWSTSFFHQILTGPCKGVRDATVHFYAEDVDVEREKG